MNYINKYDRLSNEIEKKLNLSYVPANLESKKTFRKRNIKLRSEMLKFHDSILTGNNFILIEVYDYDWDNSKWCVLALNDKRFLYEKDDFFNKIIKEDYNVDGQTDIEFIIDMISKNNLDNLFKENLPNCKRNTNVYVIGNDLKIIKYFEVNCFNDPYHELDNNTN